MVVEVKKGERVVYQCSVCKLFYYEKEWAEKCENWCKENPSCNVEITKHRIKEDKK